MFLLGKKWVFIIIINITLITLRSAIGFLAWLQPAGTCVCAPRSCATFATGKPATDTTTGYRLTDADRFCWLVLTLFNNRFVFRVETFLLRAPGGVCATHLITLRHTPSNFHQRKHYAAPATVHPYNRVKRSDEECVKVGLFCFIFSKGSSGTSKHHRKAHIHTARTLVCFAWKVKMQKGVNKHAPGNGIRFEQGWELGVWAMV